MVKWAYYARKIMKNVNKILICTLLFSLSCPDALYAKKGTPKKNLKYYQHHASARGEKKSTSAFILDAVKASAAGAVAGAVCALYGPMITHPLSYTMAIDPSFRYLGLLQKVWTLEHPTTSTEDRLKAGPVDRYGRTAEESTWLAEEWRKYLRDVGRTGAKIGFLAGAGFATYKQMRASSPEWLAQINTLREEDFTADPIILGNVSYLVSSIFHNTSNKRTSNHYELYLMPIDAEIADLFHAVVNALNADEDVKEHIAFIVVRLTPGITRRTTNRKILPRIIVGLHDGVSKANANKILKIVHNATSQNTSIDKHPRYSQPIFPPVKVVIKPTILYAALGGGDYKDVHRDEFERKTGILWDAPDDMAYKNSATEALSLFGNQQQEE
jgi:hypothetical protein